MKDRLRFELEMRDLDLEAQVSSDIIFKRNKVLGLLAEKQILFEAKTPKKRKRGKHEYYRALRHVVPKDVMKLLKKSGTFRKMGIRLNRRYVDIWTKGGLEHNPQLVRDLSEKGIVTKGPFKGRRILNVEASSIGPRFVPFGSPDRVGYYDAICIKKPAETGKWIEIVAHETSHAHNFIKKSPRKITCPQPKKAKVNQIRADIYDEISARNMQATILSEVLRSIYGAQVLRGYTPTTGSTRKKDVERDFLPSKLRNTYLEHFVLIRRLDEAKFCEKLTDSDIDKKKKKVEGISLELRNLDDYLTDPFPIFYDPKSGIFKGLYSDYSTALFYRRVIDARWKQFSSQYSEGDPDYKKAKEKVLQEHAKALLGKVISYTPQ